MPIDWNVTVLAALGVGLLVGVGVGAFLRGRSGAADRARAEQLEGELEQTREDLDAHRDEVARHFQETSDLFRDVTAQYSRLYTHLAAGARTFSTDAVAMLEGLDTPLLAHSDAAQGESAPETQLEPELEPELELDPDPSPQLEVDPEPVAVPAPEGAPPNESETRESVADSAATAPRTEAVPSVKPNGGLGAPAPPA